jgi:DNA adenine methylase
MKPFLKWAGGKQQILTDVLQLFPREIEDYYEPFVGGGSVLLGLLSSDIKVHGKVYVSDVNANLISVYQHVQQNPEELIKELQKIIEKYNDCRDGNIVKRKPKDIEEAITSQESYYYWIRYQYNSIKIPSLLSSVMFIFLNKTCFRGLYREGPNGFNVPYGNYKNPGIMVRDHIMEISKLIKDVIFTVASFEEILNKPKSGDFLYLDPPYAPETDISFVGYTSDGFNIQKHMQLFTICHELNRRCIQFLMSNADVKLVRDNMNVYTINVIICKRAINSKKPDSKANELLIVNDINETT